MLVVLVVVDYVMFSRYDQLLVDHTYFSRYTYLLIISTKHHVIASKYCTEYSRRVMVLKRIVKGLCLCSLNVMSAESGDDDPELAEAIRLSLIDSKAEQINRGIR